MLFNKLKIYKVVVLSLCMVIISCEDFLVQTPDAAITPENFFENETDFDQAVSGAYAPLQAVYDGDVGSFDSFGDWAMTEWRSDNTHFIFNVDNRGNVDEENIPLFLVTETSEVVELKWDNDFLIISRANEILGRLEEVELDNDFENRTRGHALFLRAIAYFDLVKNYGGVPIVLQPVESFQEAFNTRASREEVFNQIINDASEAANLLPVRGEQVLGRATVGTANTLLGDVFVNLERWADAEEVLREVVNSGNYGLLSNYEDIFRPANEGNEELIFDIQFAQGTSDDLFSDFPYIFLPNIAEPHLITGVEPDQNIGSDGGFNTPTPDIIAAYEDTVQDERFDASIGFWSGPIEITGFVNHQELNNGRGIPYIKKYQHPHQVFGETQQNFPVYRYAEVLLLLAEAINEQGRGSEAVSFLNQVRNRAGLDNYEGDMSQSGLRDAIFRERRVELAFENKRWNDLVRSGRAVEVMNAFGERVKNNPQAYYFPPGSSAPPPSFNVNENKLIYPIPFRETNLNPDINQNPGF